MNPLLAFGALKTTALMEGDGADVYVRLKVCTAARLSEVFGHGQQGAAMAASLKLLPNRDAAEDR